MKPEWKDAPEWAQYFAMDDDGEWYWYKNMPIYDDGIWRPNGDMCSKARYPEVNAEITLEARP